MTTELHDLVKLNVHDANGQQTERRLTVLETRFDTILNMLPDKTDLANLKTELKTDIHGEAARLSRWMAATAVTLVLGFGGMILTMMARVHNS